MDRHVEHLPAADLPVSQELQEELEAWALRYDHTLDMPQMREYRRAGWVLARRIASEIQDQPMIYRHNTPALDAPAPL